MAMNLSVKFMILFLGFQIVPSSSEEASKTTETKAAGSPKDNSLDHVSLPKIDAIKLPELPALPPIPTMKPISKGAISVPGSSNDIQKASADIQKTSTDIQKPSIDIKKASPVPCTCGVFLSGQFKRGASHSQPVGGPVLMHEYDDVFPCNAVGNKQCINKCLDVLAKHLHNSPAIICGAIDRDCYKERAYLWIQNCNASWINSNLSAGREYCCKNGTPYKCPIGA